MRKHDGSSCLWICVHASEILQSIFRKTASRCIAKAQRAGCEAYCGPECHGALRLNSALAMH